MPFQGDRELGSPFRNPLPSQARGGALTTPMGATDTFMERSQDDGLGWGSYDGNNMNQARIE